jgi:tetratricopeptide (TPR) repeat protein
MGPPPELVRAFEQAVVLFQQGQLGEAEKVVVRAQKAWPDSFDLTHFLGVVRLQSGKLGAALGLFEKALRLDPNSADAHSNLAMTLAMLGRRDEALALFNKAHALNAADWQILNNRGNLLLQLERFEEALASFEQALSMVPHPSVRLNRGTALAQLRRLDEAMAEFDAVLAQNPGLADAHFNRGNALTGLGRVEEAVLAYDRALGLRPDYPKALISRGVALQALNRNREAIADFERVLAKDKNNADAHHNAALALLTLGDYVEGLRKYEWRWQRSGMPARRSFGRPQWLGEFPLAGKTILLHAEQGLGDCIQFVRYVPLLARTGVKVVLEIPRELTALFARVGGVAQVVARGKKLPSFGLPTFDFHCPLGSLPLALKTTVATIPCDIPYLAPAPERVAKWRERLAAHPSRRVAIAWSGNRHHPNDRNRSIALEQLAPLFACHAGFVSIQHEPSEEDIAVMTGMSQLIHVGSELDDFDDTAAILSLVDLVITVDTSVAHLAGALGRPTFLLLPFAPDWRWLLDREDSPWYPTLRLFRQPAPGDWASVIARVRAELVRDSANCWGEQCRVGKGAQATN